MDEVTQQHIKTILRFLIDAEPLEQLPNTDGIFIFGHIDARVATHTARLFSEGKAPRIIVTGRGWPDKRPQGFDSEMEYLTSLLVSSGVPSSAIVGEDTATNTLENVLFGMEAATSEGFFPQSLILCAKPPLLRRSRLTFKKQFPDVVTYGSAYAFSDEEWIGKERLIRRILGEIVRLRCYAEKGDIAPISIPGEVVDAFNVVLESYPNST